MLSKEYITTQQAAKEFSYNAEYIRQLLRADKVKGVQVGRTWLVYRPSLASYIRKHGLLTDMRLAKS
jgi:excisionase family DNA binding protein